MEQDLIQKEIQWLIEHRDGTSREARAKVLNNIVAEAERLGRKKGIEECVEAIKKLENDDYPVDYQDRVFTKIDVVLAALRTRESKDL